MRESENSPSLEAHRMAGVMRIFLLASLTGFLAAARLGGEELARQGYLELGFTHMGTRILRDYYLTGQLVAAGFALALSLIYLGGGSRARFRPVGWGLACAGAAGLFLYLFSMHPTLESLLFFRWHRAAAAVVVGFALLEGLRRIGVLEAFGRVLSRPLRFPKLTAALLASIVVLPATGVAMATLSLEPFPTGKPNVLVVFVDTLRADHLGIYGYGRDTSPALDRFARESIRFAYATTPRDKTTPAMASVFTGQYPHTHGIRDLLLPLPDEKLTLTEQLEGLGYDTFAVIGNFVLVKRFSGLDQGFDVYDEELRDLESNRHTYERRAGGLTDAAIAQLEALGERPFFGWLHYMDPHGPYAPPAPFDTMFKSPPGKELPVVPLSHDGVVRDAIPRHQALGSHRDVNHYIDQYDGEIRYWDSQFERLMTWLKEQGRLDDTWIVVTADHGEAMGEQGVWFEHGHDSLNGVIHVPLLVRPPGGAPERVVSEPVQLVDLHPTLVDIVGVAPRTAVEGVSLKPWLEGAQGRAGGVAFSEWKDFSKSVQNGKWRLQWIFDAQGSVQEKRLYALETDPAEANNVYTNHPEVVAVLEPLLTGWMEAGKKHQLFQGASVGIPDPSKAAVDAATKEKLRALGYVQ